MSMTRSRPLMAKKSAPRSSTKGATPFNIASTAVAPKRACGEQFVQSATRDGLAPCSACRLNCARRHGSGGRRKRPTSTLDPIGVVRDPVFRYHRLGESFMGVFHSLESSIVYLRQLAEAGLDGVASALHEMEDRRSPVNTALWAPTAIGAAIGALSTRLPKKRRSASRAAIGSVVGSIVGCSAALAWGSRRSFVPAARGALRGLNAARDAHWLEANPIDFA